MKHDKLYGKRPRSGILYARETTLFTFTRRLEEAGQGSAAVSTRFSAPTNSGPIEKIQKNPLISIIIPQYNRKYITYAIA